MPKTFALMIHGGAGALDNIKDDKTAVRYLESMRIILEQARLKHRIMLDHDDADDEGEAQKYGTIGAVARDLKGNLAAATSTGGIVNKRMGRVGDSPVIGAGVYADSETCAVSATGYGEDFMRTVIAKTISDALYFKGGDAQSAVAEGHAEPSEVMAWARQLEALVQNLGLPGALARAAACRERAARRRYGALGPVGERMASACLTEQGDCLRDLGRLDEAAASYEEAIALDSKAGSDRDVAVGKLQLGTVRKNQRRYPQALEAYAAARRTFESLGEAASIATAWHQTGMVHKRAGDHDRAEDAYRQSLAIEVKRGSHSGEAASLTELGNLYNVMGRLEDAVKCHQQAAAINVDLRDPRHEGIARSNLAGSLIKLGRLDEARPEIRRAIACKRPFGHVTEPWTTWAILHDLERAAGNPKAAAEARRQAVGAYLAYRRDGGEDQIGGITARLCALIAQAIAQGSTAQAAEALAQLTADPKLPDYLKLLIPKLQSVLQGAHEPALAGDPDLEYDDAAELALLQERLEDG